MGRVRFVFGKEMTDEAMWEAFKKFAREAGFETKDTHKPEKKGRRKNNESKQTKG
jgi:hypothetical protein